jgi:hypothetical protein
MGPGQRLCGSPLKQPLLRLQKMEPAGQQTLGCKGSARCQLWNPHGHHTAGGGSRLGCPSVSSLFAPHVALLHEQCARWGPCKKDRRWIFQDQAAPALAEGRCFCCPPLLDCLVSWLGLVGQAFKSTRQPFNKLISTPINRSIFFPDPIAKTPTANLCAAEVPHCLYT